MPEPKVIVDERNRRKSVLRPEPAQAWKWIGWFGALLALAGLGDFALALIPLRIGVPEWEFGTVASVFSGLPLVTIGLGAVLGAVVARGWRPGIIVSAWFMVLFALVLLAGLGLFVLDIPMALRAVSEEAAVGIRKAIGKTLLLGVLFPVGYIVAAVAALRHLRRAKG